MFTIYSDRHHHHHGKSELINGEMMPCFEMPLRADLVLARVREQKLGEICEPNAFGLSPVVRVHSEKFVHFLANAWTEWRTLGRTHDALPLIWPVRGLRSDREPQDIDGKMGFYSMDAGVPITATSWDAIQSSVDVALTGAKMITQGQSAVFALCRPPGHHAAADYMGGYCYLNNAAIAAQYLRDQGFAKVAILDVDYHHGNGTQSIFYERSDVCFVSLHGDPQVEYPFFLGYADEKGMGAGFGFNHNYPLPHGTTWATYYPALQDACEKIRNYGAEVLVVSLGVDTFEHDPISRFKLINDNYLQMGQTISRLGLPTLFVMEGGYAVADIGINAVNVLSGFEGN